MTGKDCPDHGLACVDASGRCLPSCGFGWEVSPFATVHSHAERVR